MRISSWHPGWEHAVLEHPQSQAHLERVSSRIVTSARNRAPKRTGEGAASIHKERVMRGGVTTWGLGWDAEHDYMRFPEFGTEEQSAQAFLRSAVLAAGLVLVSPSE